jgi:hypothetical protein
MYVESVDTPSLLGLRTVVAQRLEAYGAFEGCTAEDQRMILARACVVIWHLTVGEEGRRLYRTHLGHLADWTLYQTALDPMTRLCADVIAAVRGDIACGACAFGRTDGIPPTGTGPVRA